MSLILHMDAAVTASVSIAKDGNLLQYAVNTTQKDHAAFLNNAITELLQSSGFTLASLDAIAVASGPGSYTGLRVAMASAKGLCYALQKPFITIGTLPILAKAAIMHTTSGPDDLFCPMIDARRMEVYTAVYDRDLKEIMKPVPVILEENSFSTLLAKNKMYFFGDGATKFKPVQSHKNAYFITAKNEVEAFAKLAYERFIKNIFTDLVDSEPLYVKDFHSTPSSHNKK